VEELLVTILAWLLDSISPSCSVGKECSWAFHQAAIAASFTLAFTSQEGWAKFAMRQSLDGERFCQRHGIAYEVCGKK